MNTFAKLLFPLFLILLVFSCREDDNFTTDMGAKLEFSVDTLRFDTAFTERGSATRFFKIYNRNALPVKISSIKIEANSGAFFRLNVDGIPGNEQSDVEIRGRDSIYLFAEVTIDPDQPATASPFIIEQKVMFETNGNQQEVLLEAWGQNANYLPSVFSSGEIWSPCTTTEIIWDDPRPYVVSGIMVLDNCTLNVPAGTRIYMHGGITRNTQLGIFNEGIIFVQEGGKIKINGTLEEPVIIEGDRIEEEFAERSGQWSGIIISNESTGNEINWAEIKNGSLGVVVDSAADLTIRNSKIFNTSSVGLVGIHSQITSLNNLFHSNGGNAVQLVYGGEYFFTHSTLASYGVDASALSMSNGVCLDDFCEFVAGNDLFARFTNTIVMGSRRDEISLSDFGVRTGAQLDYKFTNCIVRVDELLDPDKGGHPDFFQFCSPCKDAESSDVLFKLIDEDDYHLDTLSIAEGQGVPASFLPEDLDGVTRDPMNPDIGCYEFLPR